MKKITDSDAVAQPTDQRTLRDSNPDWIERQKPCDICGMPIGNEAMILGAQSRCHSRCLKLKWEEKT